MNTILQGNTEICPICFNKVNPGCGQWHHVFNGTANRTKSEEDGMKIYVHPKCHEEIHANQGLDLQTKMRAQKIWCEYYDKSENEFIERYGKNYREAFYYWQKHHD